MPLKVYVCIHLNNNAFTYNGAYKSVNTIKILDVFTEEISFECMFLGV